MGETLGDYLKKLEGVRTEREKRLLALLFRAVPHLHVAVVLGRSRKSKGRRQALVDAVEAALVEHESSAECTNPECEDGNVYEDHCPTCEQPIGRTCTDCNGTGKKQ